MTSTPNIIDKSYEYSLFSFNLYLAEVAESKHLFSSVICVLANQEKREQKAIKNGKLLCNWYFVF